MFNAIDTNHSGQLSASEVHAFLDQGMPLTQNVDSNELPLVSAVEAAINCMDRGRNGVVSEEEFVAFCLEDEKAPLLGHAATLEEAGVLAEACRCLLLDQLAGKDQSLVNASREWFQSLARRQPKVRVSELKKAIKKLLLTSCSSSSLILPQHLTNQDLDAVMQRLDQDATGWITESEYMTWVLPKRDIEILIDALKSCVALQALTPNEWFDKIDTDRNSHVGLVEFHAGLNLLGLAISVAEARVLMKEFDINEDGVLDRHEIQAMWKTISCRRSECGFIPSSNDEKYDDSDVASDATSFGYSDDFD
jgi:Ca2+-binding EF-hand superfamily protein